MATASAASSGYESTGVTKAPGIFGGAMIIAGTTVGAGMFSLPVVSAGMWFYWGIAILLFAWFAMYSSGLMILETNLHFENGSSFDTLAKETLGDWARIVNGISVAFVLYILCYAYVSGGGSMLSHTLGQTTGITLSSNMSGLVFGLVMATIVTISTRAVDRFVSVMLVVMAASFLMASGSISGSISITTLMPEAGISYAPFAFMTLPFMLTSFGFHGNVPSLVKYYEGDASKVRKTLLVGSVTGLACYVLWLFVSMGVLGRDGLKDVIAAGGNMGVLVGAIEGVINNTGISTILNTFANLAVASSFLGVSLGLFDYLADVFKLSDDVPGRIKTALLTFAPPIILGAVFPDGFIMAIGFAALAATVFTAFIPVLMVLTARRKFSQHQFTVTGGKARLCLVITFGALVVISFFMNMFGILPAFG